MVVVRPQLSTDGPGFSVVETGVGSLQLFASGYPILNFCWAKTGIIKLWVGVYFVGMSSKQALLLLFYLKSGLFQ